MALEEWLELQTRLLQLEQQEEVAVRSLPRAIGVPSPLSWHYPG